MKKILFVFLCVLGLNLNFYAQDIHFTMMDMAPVILNPANTGNYAGSYRIGGIFRDQAFAFSSGDYKTPNFYMDANFAWGFRKQDWTSVGINFFQDRSGEIGLGSGSILAAVAYHFSLDKSQTKVISLGAEFGGVQTNIKNIDKALFFDQLPSGAASPDKASLQEKADYREISGGLTFTAKRSNSDKITIGLSSLHLNKPKVSYVNSAGVASSNVLGMLISANAAYLRKINTKIDVEPSLLLRSIGKETETIVQGKLGYMFNAEKQIKLIGGLGYRFGDALQIMVGAEFKSIKAMVAYDQTTSNLSSGNSGVGALELAVSYIGLVKKKVSPKPQIFCPRF